MQSKDKALWNVDFSHRTDKNKDKLPTAIQDQLAVLVKEITLLGPYRINWKNYGPLKKGPGIPDNAHHCHLKKGRPTYVACWRIVNKIDKRVEVFYVGSHENSPY